MRADRDSMVVTDMVKKFRGYFHFIKKQQKHREAFGVHPIRAGRVETTDEVRRQKLMQLVNHPFVAGPSKRASLFWVTIYPPLTHPTDGSPTLDILLSPSQYLIPFGRCPTAVCRPSQQLREIPLHLANLLMLLVHADPVDRKAAA